MDMITGESPWVSFSRLAKTEDFCDFCQCKDPAAQENSEKYSADSQEKRSQWDPDRKEGNDGSGNGSQK